MVLLLLRRHLTLIRGLLSKGRKSAGLRGSGSSGRGQFSEATLKLLDLLVLRLCVGSVLLNQLHQPALTKLRCPKLAMRKSLLRGNDPSLNVRPLRVQLDQVGGLLGDRLLGLAKNLLNRLPPSSLALRRSIGFSGLSRLRGVGGRSLCRAHCLQGDSAVEGNATVFLRC